MPNDAENPRRLAYYFAISQVGMEMAAPIGVGYLLDAWLGWLPWATIVGAVVGFAGGLVHLVALSKRAPQEGPAEGSSESPSQDRVP
jgi:F0F1-type ATP synthase assembly protein I